jgi:hypothetical protein
MFKDYTYILVRSFVVIFSLCFTSLATAQEKPADLADVWVMVPNAGQSTQFEAAFRKHLNYRKNNGDTRQWNTYTPVVGSDLNHYIVRFCCTKWAEVDRYVKVQEKGKMSDDWNNNVAKYIKRYEHYYARLDFANSNWPAKSDFNFFAVTRYQQKMGTAGSVSEGKKALSGYAKAMKWPYSWSWSEQIGGSGGLSLVIPYNDYAGMTPPEVSFYQAVGKHLGDEAKTKALFDRWSDNFKATDYTVYKLRKDLAMP